MTDLQQAKKEYEWMLNHCPVQDLRYNTKLTNYIDALLFTIQENKEFQESWIDKNFNIVEMEHKITTLESVNREIYEALKIADSLNECKPVFCIYRWRMDFYNHIKSILSK